MRGEVARVVKGVGMSWGNNVRLHCALRMLRYYAKLPDEGTVTKIRKTSRKAQKVSLAAAFRRKAGLAHLHGLVVHPRLKSASVRYSAEVTIDRLRLLTREHHCLKAGPVWCRGPVWGPIFVGKN
eukprot:s181_g41.t1